MSWKVSDVITMLQKEFKPDDLIAFSLLGQREVSRRLQVEGSQLEFIMTEFMRLVDNNEPVLWPYLEVAVENVDTRANKCVCCASEGIWPVVHDDGKGGSIALPFCSECETLKDVFIDLTPIEVLGGTPDLLRSNFKNYLQWYQPALTWAEYNQTETNSL